MASYPYRVDISRLKYAITGALLQRMLDALFNTLKQPANVCWGFPARGVNPTPGEVLFADAESAGRFAEHLTSALGRDGEPPFGVVTWTMETARVFVRDLTARLQALGFAGIDIVGSVAQKGASANDLDLLLRPNVELGLSLNAAIELIERDLLPHISSDQHVNPLEAFGRDAVWFLNVGLRDGRVVELYLDEADFPMDEHHVSQSTESTSSNSRQRTT